MLIFITIDFITVGLPPPTRRFTARGTLGPRRPVSPLPKVCLLVYGKSPLSLPRVCSCAEGDAHARGCLARRPPCDEGVSCEGAVQSHELRYARRWSIVPREVALPRGHSVLGANGERGRERKRIRQRAQERETNMIR